MPQISIVVPVYKVEKYLRRCVESLINQSFSEFDLILVDDGSPDECGLICDRYAEMDKRIHVIHQNNAGLSEARNSGVEWSLTKSDSQWITFVDSDDWVHPQYLQILYEAAVKYKTDISVCAYREIDENTVYKMEPYDTAEVSQWRTEDFFAQYRLNATVAWGKLYKKSYFSNFRYPAGKIHEDEFVTYKLLFGLPYIAYTSKPLYYYYINRNGIMRSVSMSKRTDAVEAYLQQLDFFEKNKFYKAQKSTIHAYVGELCSWINETNRFPVSEKNNRQFQRKLLKQLKDMLKQYKKQIPFKECRWAYAVAYPLRVKCIGLAQSVRHKAKRVLCRGLV